MFLAAPAPRRRVFTLIELLVVVAIIAVLASILLPTLANARAKARETQCATNLKQLLMAYTLYLSESDERIPYNVASGLRPNAWDGVA